MEPRVQYAQTADGVSIAFWTLGEGMPLVVMPSIPWNHVQLEWRQPDTRRWYETLAKNRRVVRYDVRGTGMSDRDAVDFSIAAQVLDLESIVDRLDLEVFVLLGLVNSGPAAIAYAAEHPRRVSHLILWGAWAQASDWSTVPGFKAMRGLLGRDWETYTEAYTHVTFGWSLGEEVSQAAAVMRETIAQDAWLAWAEAVRTFDVADKLALVKSPTLVLHHSTVGRSYDDVARRLASGIRDARLVGGEGVGHLLSPRDQVVALAAIDEFLDEGERAAARVPPAEPGTVHTILFTDVEGSTAMTQRLGDAKAREVLREHERITRDALKAHGGSEIKTMGDGFMASFTSATRALECAVAMQQAFEERNRAVGAQQPPEEGSSSKTSPAVAAPLRPAEEKRPVEPIHIRIGLNAGEPIAEEDDLFGTAVITAARIAAQAEGGEILVSDVVRQLVAGKGFLFSDRGEHALRGFEDPVRVHEVRWRDA